MAGCYERQHIPSVTWLALSYIMQICMLLQETRMDGCGDGSWKDEQYFSCRDGHAMFIVLSKLKPDSRFVQQPQGDNRKLLCVCVSTACIFWSSSLVYATERLGKCCSQDMQHWKYNRISRICVGTLLSFCVCNTFKVLYVLENCHYQKRVQLSGRFNTS